MGTEDSAVGQVKRVLFISRRVIRRSVKGIETVPFRFDVGAFGESEPHSTEDPDCPVEH